MLIKNFNCLLEKARLGVELMSALYLHDLDIKENSSRPKFLALFFIHCVKGINYAVMQASNFNLILQLSVYVLKGFHCGNNFIDRIVYLKQDLNELRKRGAKTQQVFRIPFLAEVHIRYGLYQEVHFPDAGRNLGLEERVFIICCCELCNSLELCLDLFSN